MTNVSSTIAVVKAIIVEQKTIIGPMAIDQANRVSGLHVSPDLATIEVQGDGKFVISELVMNYKKLFGEAGVMACKEAIKEHHSDFSSSDLPAILQ